MNLTMAVGAKDVALRGVSTLTKAKVRFSQTGEQFGFKDAQGNEYGILGDHMRIQVQPNLEPQTPTLAPFSPTYAS